MKKNNSSIILSIYRINVTLDYTNSTHAKIAETQIII